eukprot:CAMPEP_0204897978 /NCGR_PEP_ID=MMETSP1397-20131031/1027_1 /ASSEMBLY_ACC=CAM_ASM_000891 /TAXON_ID=49980 /ORGANISM="Climacostomum Climacostomum virens, Strain Stock W-24" /LENGTH=761 /DNA_ID=CAMNT_0052065765 /DNA_START=176 /DNA_END=2457 /DNA_ORIENTATION=+
MSAEEPPYATSLIDRWAEQEKTHRLNERLKGDENFEGPTKARSCTDLVFLAIFLLATATCATVSVYYFIMGDPNRLIHGYDFRAELCGVDSFDDAKYTYFVNPAETTDVAICLSGCPVVNAENAVCLYDTDGETELLDNCYDAYESKPYYNRYCLPADEDLRDEVDDFFDNHESRITLILGDIYRGWDVMGIACLIAIGVGLSFMVLMRFGWMTYIAVYSSVLLVALEFAAVVYLVYRDSDRVDDNRCDEFGPVDMEDCDSDEDRYMVLTYVVGAVCIFIVLLAILLVPSMRRAIYVFRGATRPLRNVFSLFLFPILALFIGGGVLTSLVFSLIYGGSVGDINTIDEDTVPGGEVKELDFYWRERYILLFVIFVHLWWLSFVATISEYLVASVATFWFFSKDKAILNSPVTSSAWNLFSNHIGSVALGSILIPVFRLPRVIVSGLKGIATRLNLEMKKCCSVTCYPCLSVHEHFLKYMVEDAYVYQAIWGTTFCASAKRSYFVVKRSEKIPAKQLINSAHTSIWLMQIVVTVSAPIFTYYWIVEEDETFMEEQTRYVSWATCLACLTLVGSSFVAQVIGGFFRGLIHASVHCLVSDSEMFVGDQRFAEAELMQILHIDEADNVSASGTWAGESKNAKKVVPMPDNIVEPGKNEIDTARGMDSPHQDERVSPTRGNTMRFDASGRPLAAVAAWDNEDDYTRQEGVVATNGLFGNDLNKVPSLKPGEAYGQPEEPDLEVTGRPPSAKQTSGGPRGRGRGRGRG